jgi:type I restriction enzyme S subunit
MPDNDEERTVTPRLRFPEFRNTPGWQARKLGDFITERDERASSDIPLYSLTIESGVTAKTERYERSFLVADETDAYKVVRPNDFAFNPMNLRFGAIGRHSEQRPVALSKYYNIFNCDRTVDSVFCDIYFRSDVMVALYDRIATGSLIEKRRVHFDRFLRLDILFPSTVEQQKIADCLTSLDACVAAQGRKVKALKAHKKGLMQQLFTREGETLPRLRFPEFRDAPEWESQTLGNIVKISKGKGVAKADVVENGKTPCIRYAELYTCYGEIISDVRSRTDTHVNNLVLSEAGDVIIPASGETKEDIATCACVLDAGVALGSDLNVLRSDIDGCFLSYYLNGSKRAELAKVAQGDTVAHLYPSQISQLAINFPSDLPEQQRIADCLSALDARTTAEGEKLAGLKLHKKGLMQKLFPSPEGD